MADRKAAVLAVARTPLTRPNGVLSRIRADEAAASVLRELYHNRLVLSGQESMAVVVAHGITDFEQGMLFARSIVRLAGLPEGVPAWSMNAYAVSSMVGLDYAHAAAVLGRFDVVVMLAVDFPSRTPVMGFNPSFSPAIYGSYPEFYTPLGLASEWLANRYRLSREEIDDWANESRRRARTAKEKGVFRAECVDVSVEDQDQNVHVQVKYDLLRPVRDISEFAAAEPIFLKDGVLTSENTAELTDGAAAVALSSIDFAQNASFEPLCYMHAPHMVAGSSENAPLHMMKAVEELCTSYGITVDSFGFIDVDEPAASVPLSFAKHFLLPLNRINETGGALALGHPYGASGARMVVGAAARMEREGSGSALVCQFGEGGLGVACMLERQS